MDTSVKGNMSKSIFALEDSKELFEAIGGLNDDQNFGNSGGIPQPDNTEYGVDDMLTVIPGSTDPYAGQSITAKQEPTAEEKRFVLDQFAEQMAKNHMNVVDKNAIDTLAPIVQNMVGSNINVNQFLTELQDQAFQRIGAQNVSEAQPTGAVPDEEGLAGQGEVGAPGAMPQAADPTALGPGAETAPGGIPAEPSLDANVGDPNAMGGDDLGLGGIGDDTGNAGLGGDDLGLGGIGDDTGNVGLDSFGADGGAAGGNDLGLDGIGGDDTAGGDLGLDGIGSEGGEPGETGDVGGSSEGDLGGEGDTLPEGDKGDDSEGDLFGDSNLDSLSDDSFGGDDTDKDKDDKGPSTSDDSDAEFEAELSQKMPILESLRAKYMDDVAKERASAALCEFVQRRQMEKKAKLEAQSKAFAAEQVKFEAAATTMRNELGNKVGELIADESNKRAESILENASRAYENAKKRKAGASMTARSKPAQVESVTVPSSLKAKLESIAKDYHAAVARDNKAKLEAAAKDIPAPKLESQATPKNIAGKKPKTMLESQLAEILARH